MSLFIRVSGHSCDAPAPLVGWLTAFLWDHLDDPVDHEDLHRGEEIHYIDISGLSDRAQSQLLRALAEDLVPAAEEEIAADSSILPDRAAKILEVLGDMARAAALSGPHREPAAYHLPWVILSEQYDWPMPFGLWPFVARLLREHVGADAAQAIGDTTIDLRRLSGPSRIKALLTLAEEAEAAAPAALDSMIVGSPGHHQGSWDHPLALKEVRALALIARQVVMGEGTEGSRDGGSGRQEWRPTATIPRMRRISLDRESAWLGEEELYVWVVQFLCQRRERPYFLRQLARTRWFEIPHEYSRFSRPRVLRALAMDLPAAVEADPRWNVESAFAAGRLKTLSLMAADALAAL